MTNVKTRKWLSLAVAVLMVLGMLTFFPALPVAQAASYSSSWFTDKSAINVASVHEGITLRPTEKTPKEYGYDSENGVYRTYDQNVVNLEHLDEGVEITRATSYATYSNQLYLGEKFSIEFEVLKKNFKTLEITFLSDDDTKVKGEFETEEDIRIHDIENKVVIPADKLTAGSTYTLVCTTTYNQSTYNQSTGRYTLSFSGIEGIEVGELETIPLNQAQVKFGFTGVSEVFAKDASNEDEEDNTEYDYASICLTKMGEGENLQSFVTRNADSTIIDDTQKPVIRIDSAKMNSEDGVDDTIVRNAEYSLSYTALDVVKSSTSTKMTVKFSQTLPEDYAQMSTEDQVAFWDGEDIEVFRENITTTKFTPDKIGYYAITSLTASDGTNTSDTLVKNDNSPVTTLVFRVVERLDNVYDTTNSSRNAAIGYNFDNYKAKYAKFPKTLEGGSNATVTFITPTLWAPTGYTVADLTPAEGETESKVEKDFKTSGEDFYSIIGVDGEELVFETNVNAVTYSLKYRLSTSTSYTTLTGLKFTPSAKGPYDFSLSVTDRVGNKTEYNIKQNFLEGISFYDTESPVISVTGFSETAYLNQSTTIVSGTITDNFDTSATKTVKVILVAKYKTNDNGELVDANGKKIDTDGSYEDYKDQLVVDTEAITWKRKQGLFKVNDDNKLVDADGNVIATENNRLVNESDIEKLVRDDIEGIRIKDPDGNYVMVDDYEQDYVKDDDGKAVLDEDGNKQYLYEMNEDGTYKVDSEGRRIPLYTQKNRQELVVSTSTTFTPTDYGIYRVVYEGKDSSGNLASYQVHDLYVVPAPPAPVGGLNLSTTSIVFLCIAGACLIGIIVLLLIPTKEVPKKGTAKPAKKDDKKA